MNPAQAPVPEDFVPLTIVLPRVDQAEMLGYMGSSRFVGFYWDTELGGAVWNDGNQPRGGRSENFTFNRFIRPLAFLYNVNFGTRGGMATHILIWDREHETAYMAPRDTALRFLREHNAADRVPSPGELAGPMQ